MTIGTAPPPKVALTFSRDPGQHQAFEEKASSSHLRGTGLSQRFCEPCPPPVSSQNRQTTGFGARICPAPSAIADPSRRDRPAHCRAHPVARPARRTGRVPDGLQRLGDGDSMSNAPAVSTNMRSMIGEASQKAIRPTRQPPSPRSAAISGIYPQEQKGTVPGPAPEADHAGARAPVKAAWRSVVAPVPPPGRDADGQDQNRAAVCRAPGAKPRLSSAARGRNGQAARGSARSHATTRSFVQRRSQHRSADRGCHLSRL